MGRTFPTDREEKRQVLLAAVECVRDTLRAGADEAEANATLPPATVQALDDAGLLALKLPAVLGGAEADLVTQLEVLEAVTYIDTSTGWCPLIGTAAIASLRDINAAAQHLMVSDAAYETMGNTSLVCRMPIPCDDTGRCDASCGGAHPRSAQSNSTPLQHLSSGCSPRPSPVAPGFGRPPGTL
jgi:Acyl-CoA dehydrogenase, N-terminal domain